MFVSSVETGLRFATPTKTGLSRQKDEDAHSLFPGVNVDRLRRDVAGTQILADGPQHRRRPRDVVRRVERATKPRPDGLDRHPAGIDGWRIAIAIVLDKIGHVERWQALPTAFHDVAIDQQAVRSSAISE